VVRKVVGTETMAQQHRLAPSEDGIFESEVPLEKIGAYNQKTSNNANRQNELFRLSKLFTPFLLSSWFQTTNASCSESLLTGTSPMQDCLRNAGCAWSEFGGTKRCLNFDEPSDCLQFKNPKHCEGVFGQNDKKLCVWNGTVQGCISLELKAKFDGYDRETTEKIEAFDKKVKAEIRKIKAEIVELQREIEQQTEEADQIRNMHKKRLKHKTNEEKEKIKAEAKEELLGLKMISDSLKEFRIRKLETYKQKKEEIKNFQLKY
jgi:hypothetical protein